MRSLALATKYPELLGTRFNERDMPLVYSSAGEWAEAMGMIVVERDICTQDFWAVPRLDYCRRAGWRIWHIWQAAGCAALRWLKWHDLLDVKEGEILSIRKLCWRASARHPYWSQEELMHLRKENNSLREQLREKTEKIARALEEMEKL